MNNFMFGGGFEIMFFLIFGIVILTFVINLGRGAREWSSNNSKPVEAKSVKVVGKRTHTWGRGSGGVGVHHHHHHHTRTSYYVTFEFENGDRLELHVSGKKFGEIVEEDIGMLTYQGTRFHEFERSRW